MLTLIAAAALFSTVAVTQTFPGFVPSCTSNLVVDFPLVIHNVTTTYPISPPGELFTHADGNDLPVCQDAAADHPVTVVASAPDVWLPEHDPSLSSAYLLLMIDPAVKAPGTGASTTFLHYLHSDLALFPSTRLHPTNVSSTAIASYVGPDPPAGGTPHNYQLLLYLQPSNFTFPADLKHFLGPVQNLTDTALAVRIGFNATNFAQEAGLGSPMAANWFRVGNVTTSASGTATSPAQTTSTNAASTATLHVGASVRLFCCRNTVASTITGLVSSLLL
ncbi:MAG: hypothetical protein M1818_002239 [Claussenomyces sp. TS43310]|nr:MAG: hypothetical protein M1818_002239 [Claussenomyces sp. TS43310]